MSDHNDLDWWHQSAPRCPHCSAYQEFDDYAQQVAWEDGGTADVKCRSCDKSFVCVSVADYKFSTAVSEEAASDEMWGPQQADEAT